MLDGVVAFVATTDQGMLYASHSYVLTNNLLYSLAKESIRQNRHFRMDRSSAASVCH